MQFSWKDMLKALPVLLLLAAGAAFGAAGNVQFVIGDVKLVTKAGETRALVKGAEINEGDRIITAAGASAQLKMVDGGFIAVRPNTSMSFDTYRYSGKEDGTENAVVSLLQGGFRTITGLIGHTNKQNYLIKTETATIGIRGTDHEPMVILPPLPGQAAIAPPGTYDKVNVGVAFIRTDAGSVDIQRNQVGFAPITKAAPVILPRIPPFYKPTPAPGPQKAKEEAKDEDKKETAAAAPAKAGEEKKEAAPAAAAPAATTPAETAAETTAATRSTAVVDPTTVVTTAPAAAPVATAPAVVAPVIAITGTDATGTTVNTTTQTLATSSGTSVPLAQGAYALQAQQAADAATASVSALNALLSSAATSVASTPADSAVSAAQTATNAASSANTSISTLTIDTALATSNAATSTSVANTATGQVNTATSTYNTNGAFADATVATPAFSAMNSANSTLQAANTSVQSAASTASSQSTALSSAQSAASTALATANQALTAANGALSALSAAGVATSSTASSLLSAAQTAATAAQAAATQAQTLQTAGDFNGAQAQLVIAQQQAKAAADALAAAGQVLTAVASATAAQAAANAITAASTGLASAASAAQTAGASAVATTTSQLATAQAQATSVQQNAVLAQYSNPAVASSNFTHGVMSMKPVTGGAEHTTYDTNPANANSNYLLDQNKNLVEIRNTSYDRFGWNYSGTILSNADIKFSGGTAKDGASDPTGVYYFGRWQGGQVNVTDLATSGALAPFSDALGATSAHWIIGLAPGNSTLPGNTAGAINNTQAVTGTANYTLAGATHPTDSLGNVGTLNSATLAANFSSQTLNAALNLSFSSTDTANPSTRNLSINASASNVPIKGSGFDAYYSAPYAPVINCTSASGDCAAAGYIGDIGGSFLSSASSGSTAGGVGTGVGIGYSFTPNITSTAANQPFGDLIQGVGVLNTASAPAVGVTNFSSSSVLRDEIVWPTTQIATGANPNATTYIVSDKNKENLFYNSSGTPYTPLTTALTTPVTLTGPTANTNFLFDANGNLVRIFDTPHVVFDHGSDVPGGSTQFATPTPLAHAELSFGGTATSENYSDPGTGVRFGRWTGGVVNVTDLSTGSTYIESLTAPGGAARSLQWVVAQTPSSLPTTGEFHYTRINGTAGTPSFATGPTDSYGNVGTLDGARLTADFTNMRASAGVRITMPSGPAGSLGVQTLSAMFSNAPISGGGFNVSSGNDNGANTDNLHISCTGSGCAPDITTGVSAYNGRIRGGFDSATGNAGTADGAFMRYTFNTGYGASTATPPGGRVVDDYINGLVAFRQGPAIALPTSSAYPTAAPIAPVVLVANYSYNSGSNIFTGGQTYWVDHPSTGLVTDAAGNLVSVAEDSNSMHGDGNSLALSGGTATPATPTTLAIGSAASATDGNILLGWQQASPALSVSGVDYSGCFGIANCTANPTSRTVLADGLSWVRGPAPFPDYLPSAIAGYSNASGLVVPSIATYNLGASVLHDQTGATGSVTSAGLTVNFNSSSVAFNMAATTAAGNWAVTSGGIKLSQDGSFYASSGSSPTITSGTTIAPTSTHDQMSVTLNGSTGGWGNVEGQLMGIGLGGAGVTYDLNSNLPCTSGPCPNVTASGALAFGLTSTQQPYSTLTPYKLIAFTTGMNAAGQFDSSENYRIQGGFVSPYRTQTVDGFPVRIDGELPIAVTYPAPCTLNCGPNINGIPAIYAAAGATGVASVGTATLLESGYDLATGIRWGRYGNGTIGVNDRISGASLGTLDVAQQNSHFIMTLNQSGPTVLPITGTFNYSFVGGTSPTDSKGNVGAALTAANASLTANFSAQTVDASLSNLVVGGNTWSASATGIPIVGSVFQAEKKLGGGGNLTVTSSLGANTAGSLAGAFTGATGAGAAMLYSLNYAGNVATNPAAVTVSGVAAFKR